MKKILLIDDEKSWLDNLKKDLEKRGCLDNNFIVFSDSIGKYFLLKENSVELRTDIDAFQYIFIHKSINDPKLPGNIFELIKYKTGEKKIYTFSGGAITRIEDQIFNRRNLYDNMVHFVCFYKDYNDWFIPVLYYYDYRKRYMRILLNKVESENRGVAGMDNLFHNKNLKKIFKVLDLSLDIISKHRDKDDFLRRLKQKIEEYG